MKAFLVGLCAATLSVSASANPDLMGKWRSPFLSLPMGFQLQAGFDFFPEHVVFTAKTYFSNGVFKDVGLYSERKFKLLKMESASHMVGGINIDVESEAAFDTPLTQSAVDEHNQKSKCGFTDWAVGVTKDITNLECGEEGESDIFTPGDKAYSLIQLEGESLYMAAEDDEFDASSPERRPTKVTKQMIFSRTE